LSWRGRAKTAIDKGAKKHLSSQLTEKRAENGFQTVRYVCGIGQAQINCSLAFLPKEIGLEALDSF